MMEYKEIVKMDSPCLKKSIEMISDFLSSLDCEEEVEELLIEQLGMFNNKHFDSDTAHYVVSHMEPSIGHEKIESILANNNIDVYRAKELIRNAYQQAVLKASEHGWTAPRICDKYNDWDYYVTLAMVMSDYWFTVNGNLETAGMLAYEFMSDVDGDKEKVWEYFF